MLLRVPSASRHRNVIQCAGPFGVRNFAVDEAHIENAATKRFIHTGSRIVLPRRQLQLWTKSCSQWQLQRRSIVRIPSSKLCNSAKRTSRPFISSNGTRWNSGSSLPVCLKNASPNSCRTCPTVFGSHAPAPNSAISLINAKHLRALSMFVGSTFSKSVPLSRPVCPSSSRNSADQSVNARHSPCRSGCPARIWSSMAAISRRQRSSQPAFFARACATSSKRAPPGSSVATFPV